VRDDQEQDYGRFVEARLDRLRRFGYLLCGDWHLAEDAVQAALTKLYVVWPRVSRFGEVDAYVRRIVVSCLADERRRGFRRRERSTATLPDRGGVADHAAATTNRLTAAGALARLPRRQRATIVLRYWEDLSVEQTAQLLGCSTGTVKSQCARGLQTLRELLDEPVEPQAEGAC
jgi:RNA polymerase sigma-70 factor (sigma-E family)